jgi:hypothetical protein
MSQPQPQVIQPRPTGYDFPVRETCDPNNPEEAFLWMLVALPHQKGAPLIMPPEYLRLISKRLWDCGARPVEEPIIKYRRPGGTDPHWMMSPGSWVSLDAADPPANPSKAAWDSLTRQQKAEIFALAKEEHERRG